MTTPDVSQPDRSVGQRLRSAVLAIVVLPVPFVVPIAAVMYGVTTFLFHFSGGQYRMGPIVNAGALIAIGTTLGAGVITGWRTDSRRRTFAVMLQAAWIVWLVVLVAEWLLSFRFGAT